MVSDASAFRTNRKLATLRTFNAVNMAYDSDSDINFIGAFLGVWVITEWALHLV